jgi:hypothetical protein
MFKRNIDVYATDKTTGETYILVNHEDGVNNLICKGKIQRFCGTEVDKLTLRVYNLSSTIVGNIASNYSNYTISVLFGYEDDGQMNTIFEGNLMRIMNQRENEVTNKTTFYVYDSGDFSTYGFYSGSYDDGANYYQIAKDVCSNGTYKVSYNLSEKLKNYTVSGSLVFYKSQAECLQDIADKCDMLLNIENDYVSIYEKESGYEDCIVFSQENKESGKVESKSGLIGIPTLEQDGLSFECLINSRMSIYRLVLINNSIISSNQTGVTPSRDYGAQLDSDNLYRVISFSTDFANNGGKCKTSVRALSREIFDGI